MQSLFPSQAGGNNQTQPLYQFRAGKCQLTSQPNGKFLVSADLRRGQIQLVRGADTLLHFRWANFTTGTVEDDRIVMPGDCIFKKVQSGRSDDRVYMLKFNYNANNQNRLMFWFQNKDSGKDEEIVKKVNDLLNNPNAVQEAANPTGPAGGLGGLLGLGGAGGGNPPPWMQQYLANGRPGAANPAAAPANPLVPNPNAARGQPNPNAGAFGGLDFATLLNQLNPQAAPQPAPQPPSSSGQAAGRVTMEDVRRALAQSGTGGGQARATPNLQDILTGEEIIRSGVLNDPDVRNELIAQLPPQQQTSEHLEATIRSPQLQQSITSLNESLSPDNFHNIATNFGLNPSQGTEQLMRGDGVGAFLASVQASHPAETQHPTQTPANQEEKKDNEDTKMEE